MEKIKKYVPYAIVLIVGLMIGWIPKGRLQKETIVEKRDTLIVRDTVTVYQPKEVVRERLRTEYVKVRDTVRIHDTLYMSLELEKRVYKRDEFYAEVTGYNPALTYIEVYPKTMYVTETVKKKDKRNYLSAGVEAMYCGNFHAPVYLEYERLMHQNFSIYVRGARDIVIRTNIVSAGAKVQFGW